MNKCMNEEWIKATFGQWQRSSYRLNLRHVDTQIIHFDFDQQNTVATSLACQRQQSNKETEYGMHQLLSQMNTKLSMDFILGWMWVSYSKPMSLCSMQSLHSAGWEKPEWLWIMEQDRCGRKQAVVTDLKVLLDISLNRLNKIRNTLVKIRVSRQRFEP